ncbi:MAG: hypothetical protein SGI94_14350 [Saprospiraceae bacterium]|nr:hypothetical protein [Saprospiraceae bacterium]
MPFLPAQLSVQQLRQHYFNVFASSQGFLKYYFEEDRISASAPFVHYQNVVDDLYGELRQDIGTPTIYLTPEWEGEESSIVYLFEVSQPNPQSFLELEALVSVKSTQGQFYLHRSAVIAEYDPAVLGNNIVQNGMLQIENTGISTSSNYSVQSVDLASNQVKIEVASTTTDVSSMFLLGNSFSPLLKLKLTLQELADPGILIDETQMGQFSVYYNPETERPKTFWCIEVQGDFNIKLACSPPVITSFSPNTVRAGTCDTLVIRGMCFDLGCVI